MTGKTSRQCLDREQVYAILRVDEFQGDLPVERKVTVKAVVFSLEMAQAEVARLNTLRPAATCHYYWQSTRLLNAPASVLPTDDSETSASEAAEPTSATVPTGLSR